MAVDVDQRGKSLGLGIAGQLDRPVDHEYAEACDILADSDGKRIVVARYRSDEEGPKPAIEQQRLAEVSLAALPCIANRLEPRGRPSSRLASRSRAPDVSLAIFL